MYDPSFVTEREHRHVLGFSYQRYHGGEERSEFTIADTPSLAFAARATPGPACETLWSRRACTPPKTPPRNKRALGVAQHLSCNPIRGPKKHVVILRWPRQECAWSARPDDLERLNEPDDAAHYVEGGIERRGAARGIAHGVGVLAIKTDRRPTAMA